MDSSIVRFSKDYFDVILRSTFLTIKFSWLSIFIIIILMVIVSFTAQGGTLMVDLFQKPYHAVWAMILVNFLALVLSHYPAYISEYYRGDKGKLWKMVEDSVFFGFGYIFYVAIEGQRDDKEGDSARSTRHENMFRRFIGLAFYLTWIAGLLTVYNSYFDNSISVSLLTGILGFFFFLLYYYLDRFKKKVKQNISVSVLSQAKKIFIWYILILLLVVISFIALIIVSYFQEWSKISWAILFISSLLSCISFIFFRNLRSLFYRFFGLAGKHDFRSKGQTQFFDYNSYPFNKANNHPAPEYNTPPWYFIPYSFIRNISNNVTYIRSIAVFGKLNAIILLSITLYYLVPGRVTFMSNFNPLVIVMSWVVFYYTIIVIFIKHILFYKQNEWTRHVYYDSDYKIYNPLNIQLKFSEFLANTQGSILYPIHKSIFNKYFPLLGLAIFIITICTIKIGNNRHEIITQNLYKPLLDTSYNAKKALQNLYDHNDSIHICNNVKSYFSDFKSRISDSDNYYTISTYGGGLKANAWTLLVLDSLYKNNNKLLEHTLSISAVSGGSIGVANFYTMLGEGHTSREPYIEKIGLSNTLSHEAHYLFSWDFIANLLPFNYKPGEDRSFYSMKENAILSSNKNTYNHKDSINLFPNYWKTLYDAYKVPPFFANSKSTSFYYGITSPFHDMRELGAAIDIVHTTYVKPKKLILDKKTEKYIPTNFKLETKVPSFYDAVSPTNRFPIASPAAKIHGKGHFVDGGYFDNSGLMTTYNFTQKFKEYSGYDNHKDIIIVTGKDQYIRYVMENSFPFWVDKPSLPKNQTLAKIKNSEEYKSIVMALIDLDGLPYAMEDIYKHTLRPIHLPHKIHLSDLEKMYKGNVHANKKLKDFINTHNEIIESTLSEYNGYEFKKWGVVEPPLSRLLSKPGFEYQKAMLKLHPLVQYQLKSIYN